MVIILIGETEPCDKYEERTFADCVEEKLKVLFISCYLREKIKSLNIKEFVFGKNISCVPPWMSQTDQCQENFY